MWCVYILYSTIFSFPQSQNFQIIYIEIDSYNGGCQYFVGLTLRPTYFRKYSEYPCTLRMKSSTEVLPRSSVKLSITWLITCSTWAFTENTKKYKNKNGYIVARVICYPIKVEERIPIFKFQKVEKIRQSPLINVKYWPLYSGKMKN